jgi:AbrB family looped-hinge helix DNA binding protein
MSIPHSRLTAQGQISVPAEVRRRLGLAPGSVLEWEERDGEYVVRRAGGHSSEAIHAAVFPKGVRRGATRDVKAGIRTYVRRKHAGR